MYSWMRCQRQTCSPALVDRLTDFFPELFPLPRPLMIACLRCSACFEWEVGFAWWAVLIVLLFHSEPKLFEYVRRSINDVNSNSAANQRAARVAV